MLTVRESPGTTSVNQNYVSNRAPLLPSPLIKLPPGSITPRGWVRTQLKLCAEGMIGHLPELSKFCRADSGWLTFKDPGWEEVPYWLKGYGDLGYVLKDERIIEETRRWLGASLKSQDPDGYFGPLRNKEKKPVIDLWPNMIMLFAFRSYYEAMGDEHVLPFMARYFNYQKSIPRHEFLPWGCQQLRAVDNLESIYWLYNHTGDRSLLELATIVFEHASNWADGIPSPHGVNICMGIRQPGVYYQQSRNPKHLEAVERNYNTVMGEYGQQPGGMFAADENCCPGEIDPSHGAETCSIVEFMYTHESLLRITGDPKYADRIEEIAFNSLPAAMTPDLRGLHYFTAPNMVQCDAGKWHKGTAISFDPWSHRCCQHNVAQGWPYYVEHLWMATGGNGLAAVLYAPCEVSAKVADGVTVTIVEETNYPFQDTVDFTFWCPRSVAFPLTLRIPRWCEAATIAVNDKVHGASPEPGSYVVIERIWENGDKIYLELPMKITLSIWKKLGDSVSVNRGPLSHSLKIGEKWVRYGGTDLWPAYEVFPTTSWNYGLVVDRNHPESSFTVAFKGSVPDQPFNTHSAPIELHVRGKRIPNWTLVDNGVGKLQPSPVRSSEPVEDIVLIPMGCARLRLSSFPTIGESPDAHEWVKGRL